MPVGAEEMIGNVERAAAKPLVRHHGAAILDAVRPLDHHGQIDIGNGDADGVAQQRGHIDRLAGAVDAALGEHESIERAGRLAPRDAAIGQIEGRAREIEEGIVAAVAGCDQHGRSLASFAAGKPRLEGDRAVGVGLLDREHVVVARKQPDLDVADRLLWSRAS